jgi:hypothetical protein
MSMTQVAFLRKADTPTKSQIEESIRGLGYDFKIVDEFENLYEQDGLSCIINAHGTYFELYFNEPDEIISDNSWIKLNMTNQDTAISFIWGADFAAGACIGLISIALIDNCNVLIYYLDDEMKYSREMLLDDIPQFLNELEKQSKTQRQNQTKPVEGFEQNEKKKGFWDKLKDMFR